MFKNLDLFDGYAVSANSSIRNVNDMCKQLGIEAVYDVELNDGLEETEESLDGWLDCITITCNGNAVINYLTCEGVIEWADGFCECAQKILNKR